MIDESLLASGAHDLGIDLSPDQIDRFSRYADRLIEWNARFNLTAITEPREIVIKHFLDSLSATRSVPPAARVIDVGAGAGFPGLPIKIAWPAISLTLLEATRKKCEFLRAMIGELHLTNVFVVNARAEDAAHDPAHRESYDVAMARAVAEMPTLLEYLLPFVRIGGVAVAQKSKEAVNDVQHAEFAMTALGGRLKDIVSVRMPKLNEARYLVVIEKTAATPEKYPRRAGMPAKKPL
jgi:16S rRNA (guanine527-N7)-methyltransferase